MKIANYCSLGFQILSCFVFSAQAAPWPNNAKSAVSITADDGWPSQLTQAAILEQKGFRGTFYLTAGGMPPVQQSAGQWAAKAYAGHEIGNHSYSHWSSQTLANKKWQELASDIGGMEWWLLSNIYAMKPVDHTYAHPEGNYVVGPISSSQSQKVGTCEYAAVLSTVVSGARIAGTGENSPANVAKRRYFLSGLPLYGSSAVTAAKNAIDNGIAKGTWTILVFHSLGDAGDGYAVTQAQYTEIVQYLASKGTDVWVAPTITVLKNVLANTPIDDWNCTQP